MLKKIMEYLNTTKRYPGKIFMKFEEDERSCEISFCVCSIRVFTKFSDDSYSEPLAWFMIKIKKYKYNLFAHAKIPMRFCFAVIEPWGLLGLEALDNYVPNFIILKAGREECTSSLNVSYT